MFNFKRVLTALCCLMLLLSLIPAVADDGFSTSYTYTYDYWEDVQESPDSYRVAAIIDAETLGLEKLDNIRIKNPQSLFVKDNYLYVCDTDNNRILVIERDGSQYVLADVISGMTGAEGEAAPAEIDPETGEIEKPEETEEPAETVPEEAMETVTEETAETEGPAVTEATPETEASADEAPAEPSPAEAQKETVSETAWDPNKFSQPYDVSVDNEGFIYIADYGNQRIVKIRKDEADQQYHFVMAFTKPTD